MVALFIKNIKKNIKQIVLTHIFEYIIFYCSKLCILFMGHVPYSNISIVINAIKVRTTTANSQMIA